MKIISANEQLAEPKGVKALIVGPSGVGKTACCVRSRCRRRYSLILKLAISPYRTSR